MSGSKPKNPDRRKLFGKILAGGAALVSNEEQILAEQMAEEAKKDGAKDTKVDAIAGASRKRQFA